MLISYRQNTNGPILKKNIYLQQRQLWTTELVSKLHRRIMNVRNCITAAFQNTNKDFKFSREFQVLLPTSPVRHSNLPGFNPIPRSENWPNNKIKQSGNGLAVSAHYQQVILRSHFNIPISNLKEDGSGKGKEARWHLQRTPNWVEQ